MPFRLWAQDECAGVESSALYDIGREVLTRLTHEAINIMVDWHPDGNGLLYRGVNVAGEQHLTETDRNLHPVPLDRVA